MGKNKMVTIERCSSRAAMKIGVEGVLKTDKFQRICQQCHCVALVQIRKSGIFFWFYSIFN